MRPGSCGCAEQPGVRAGDGNAPGPLLSGGRAHAQLHACRRAVQRVPAGLDARHPAARGGALRQAAAARRQAFAPDRPRPAHGAAHAAVLRERARRQDAWPRHSRRAPRRPCRSPFRTASPAGCWSARWPRCSAPFPVCTSRSCAAMPPRSTRACRRDRADFAIAGPLGQDWARLDSWPLFEERFELVVHEQHPLAGEKRIDARRLKEQRILVSARCESRRRAGADPRGARHRRRGGAPDRRDARSLGFARQPTSALPSCRRAPSIIRHCGESRSTALP